MLGGDPQVLSGVRVLSLAEQYPGPYATAVLSDLGADVIQVERPDGGDPARQFPGFYAALARNKKSAVIDLKSERGPEHFLTLAAETDVVLEGFRPGTVDRLGVGYQAVRAANESIVYVSISGFGQAGPYRDRPGHDITYQAAAGLLAGATADAGTLLQIGDLGAGMFAVVAVLLGLFHRERTGQGLYVDVSMLDVLVSMNAFRLVPFANDLPEATFARGPAYGRYEGCDGRQFVLGIAHEDKFWEALCRAIDLEEFVDLDYPTRIERGPELQARLEQRFATKPANEWIELLVAADVPIASVNDAREVETDPQVVARGLFVDVGDDKSPPQRFVRQPLILPGFSYTPTRPVPALGEHSDEFPSPSESIASPESTVL